MIIAGTKPSRLVVTRATFATRGNLICINFRIGAEIEIKSSGIFRKSIKLVVLKGEQLSNKSRAKKRQFSFWVYPKRN